MDTRNDDRDCEPYDVIRMPREPGPYTIAAITVPGSAAGFILAMALGHTLIGICSLVPVPLAALSSYATQYLAWKRGRHVTTGDQLRIQRQSGAFSSLVVLAASVWGIYQLLHLRISPVNAFGASQILTIAISLTAMVALLNRIVIVSIGNPAVALAVNNILWHLLAVGGACLSASGSAAS